MKLWHSFVKELNLSSKSWYFYVEISMAFIILLILLFVVPEKFKTGQDEYIYLDLPDNIKTVFYTKSLEDDLDGIAEDGFFKINDQTFPARIYTTDEKSVYYVDSRQVAVDVADKLQKFSAMASLDENNALLYTYFLQGYESEKFVNLIRVIHNDKMSVANLEKHHESQKVITLESNAKKLNDRENVIPLFLTLNGSFMGMFIIAAYIFLDKAEGIIKAYAVTPSPIWHYLLSKSGVVIVSSIIASLIVTIPIMKMDINYFIMILFLICSGFFATSIGLLIATYYKDITQSFSAIFFIIIIMILPSISYMMPSWEPNWMSYIPTYHMIQGFKDIVLSRANMNDVLMASLVFTILGLIIFSFSNYRFKKTLSV